MNNCSVCGRSVEHDDEALYKLAVPEGRTLEDARRAREQGVSIGELGAQGVTLEAICSRCQLGSFGP